MLFGNLQGNLSIERPLLNGPLVRNILKKWGFQVVQVLFKNITGS